MGFRIGLGGGCFEVLKFGRFGFVGCNRREEKFWICEGFVREGFWRL